jgi:hypothetical protein
MIVPAKSNVKAIFFAFAGHAGEIVDLDQT